MGTFSDQISSDALYFSIYIKNTILLHLMSKLNIPKSFKT